MQQKAFTLINKGMNRDLSISKVGESTAYTNHNIRIIAQDHDTLLSVTNERGNKQISLSPSISGDLVGWNVLNNHVILFTAVSESVSKIYHVTYNADGTFSCEQLYSGNLGFKVDNPIESITYYETEDIQKIYWLDGIHVLRMMNFVAKADEKALWDDTYFDSNRVVDYGLSVEISKDNSGETRENGVIQYLVTYYNKHSQETGYVWISDLVYLSPNNIGGAADGTNSNKVTLKISGVDQRFTHIRVYSIFRSSYNGQAVAYLVAEHETASATGTYHELSVIDDGAHLTSVDAQSLLFLGSKNVLAGTMTHKDGTLFLGDLELKNSGVALSTLGELIRSTMFKLDGEQFVWGTDWEAKSLGEGYTCGIDFIFSDDDIDEIQNIKFDGKKEVYSECFQLGQSSSQITTFKGGEKYRFGLVFRDDNGGSSDVFWIGDKVNTKYPVITSEYIKRVVVKCTIPEAVIKWANGTTSGSDLKFTTVKLVIAEATYADRSIKAQGVLNPTVFNVWNRYQNRLYAAPSWISRPRNGGLPARHFEHLDNANLPTGEIACNYWETVEPTAYYRKFNYGQSDETYPEIDIQEDVYDYVKILYGIAAYQDWFWVGYKGRIFTFKAALNGESSSALEAYLFDTVEGRKVMDRAEAGEEVVVNVPGTKIQIHVACSKVFWGDGRDAASRSALKAKFDEYIVNMNNLYTNWLMVQKVYDDCCGYAMNHRDTTYQTTTYFWWGSNASTAGESAPYRAPQAADSNTYIPTGEISTSIKPGKNTTSTGAYAMSYYKKQYMFVDENIVTFDSPEITYEANQFDLNENYKLRIIGYASVDTCISDTQLDATHGKLTGRNFANERYAGVESNTNLSGVVAWPLWQEIGLREKAEVNPNIHERDANSYVKTGGAVRYWLHMWGRAGIIDGWYDEDEIVFDDNHYGFLKSKLFANLKYSYQTVYDQSIYTKWETSLQTVRIFNYTSSQYLQVNVGDKVRYYDGVIDDVLAPPQSYEYPIYYTEITSNIDSEKPTAENFLFSNEPVPITYATNPHAVLSLPSEYTTVSGKRWYKQSILPKMYGDREVVIPKRASSSPDTGALLSWLPESESAQIYITWEVEPIPDDFIIDYWDQANGVVTLRREMYSYGHPQQDDWDDLFVSMCWEVAKTSYVGVPIYCRVVAHEPDSSTKYAFIVDISGYTLYHPNADYADHDTLKVTYANTLGYAAVTGSASPTVRIYHTEILDTEAVVEWGDKILNIKTAELTDASDVYPYTDYDVNSSTFEPTLDPEVIGIPLGSPYFLIGEVYYDYDAEDEDTRYGGISKASIQANNFITAGPEYKLTYASSYPIYGNEGDTYFQRWNDLRTKPLSKDKVNNVIDIISVMLESHINLDGQYDKQRSIRNIAAIDVEKYGTLNPVYSQHDNFITNHDLDSDFDLDSYKSSVTWTLEKHDSAATDEWMHITLASALKLDGDKGVCRALRRFQNSILAFQDRSLSEILFNSRTQVSTTEGVPIEIANSGKVDGKRTITNNSGCLNKWSIVEGKEAIYYVDNINKAFCAFNGNLTNLSERLGFSAWFKMHNSLKTWTPKTTGFDNFVSFYDRIRSDVYLVGNDSLEPCLVYNESLGVFTSFYDYDNVPMMTNVGDKFISFKNGLWLQNEGLYGNFFGTQKDFYTQHRVTPDPYGDKVWSNIEYRTDFYRVLNESGVDLKSEGNLLSTNNATASLNIKNDWPYQEDITFDSVTVWNEYQNTGTFTASNVNKRFRIWRHQIPRALPDQTNNPYGLDRIRNPWANVEFRKTANTQNGRDLAQMHDATIIYYE